MYMFLGFDYASPVRIDSIDNDVTSESSNLKLNTVQKDAQRWDLGITFTAGLRMNLFGRMSAHVSEHGTHSSFNIQMPQYEGLTQLLETGSTALTTNDAREAGRQAVMVVDATDDYSLPEGYFFTFSNHTKVYQVISTDPPAGGAFELNFYPPLVQDVPVGTTVHLNNVNIRVQHRQRNKSNTTNSGVLQSISMGFREAL